MNRDADKQRKAVRESLAKRRKRLRADGMCVDCGKAAVEPRHTLCCVCLHNRRRREHARVERMMQLATGEKFAEGERAA